MNGSKFELVVVGAGISGLGFAHLANQRGIKTLVLEAAHEPGGCLHTHLFKTDEGVFWAELGAHTCYNSYGNLLKIIEETGQLTSLKAKEKLRYWLQTDQGLTSIPSQLNYFELLGVIPRLLLSKKEGSSVGDYFGKIMGKRNFQRVLGPALDAVVCQPAADFPADAMFRKKPRRKEIIRSYTGPEGLQSFVNGIVSQPGLEVRVDSPVTQIEQTEDGYRVSTESGQAIETSRLALAIPPDVAARLLQSSLPQLAEPISQIQMVEIESVAVLLKADTLELQPLAGIIGRNDDFYSVVSRDLTPDPRYRAFTFHFRPGRLDDAGKMRRIREVLGVQESDILDSARYQNRLPALRLGHSERVSGLDGALRDQPLALTGNWFSGVSIEDSLVRTVQEFARLYPA
ncbi:MAG: FAD-dependent oxidoreductase [Pseudomonadota bacterium]